MGYAVVALDSAWVSGCCCGRVVDVMFNVVDIPPYQHIVPYINVCKVGDHYAQGACAIIVTYYRPENLHGPYQILKPLWREIQ